MGNFAENLNLGNRFRPPLLAFPLVAGGPVLLQSNMASCHWNIDSDRIGEKFFFFFF